MICFDYFVFLSGVVVEIGKGDIIIIKRMFVEYVIRLFFSCVGIVYFLFLNEEFFIIVFL